MTKRIEQQLNKFVYQGETLKPTLTNLILILLCSFLLVVATFTQLDFYHFIIPSNFFMYLDKDFSNPEVFNHFFINCKYIPQVPMVMFITALLGRRFGITSVVIYILVGLFFAPVFALGGGIHYVLFSGFGYIIAYIPSVFFAGSIIKDKLSFVNIAQAVFVGVLTIHIIGVLYVIFVSTLKREPFGETLGWIQAQSGIKIIYDLIFGFLAMLLAKLTKKFLWVAMGPMEFKKEKKVKINYTQNKRQRRRQRII